MKKSLLAILVLAGMILSCSLPGSTPSQSDVMTAAALTVQAVIATKPMPSQTSVSSSVTNAPLATPTESAPPLITVSEVTNCRSGPSQDYERVTQIQPGQQVGIVGYFPPSYWVVNSSAGNCWISAEFVTPSGSYQAVPTVTAPPTPDGDAPKAPTFPRNGWSYVCPSFSQIDVTFNWNDNADNETGYRIYRNDEVVAELPANSKTFSESVTIQPGQILTYRIEVYNLLGKSSTPAVVIQC
jgi:uncharacterized protein YraI